MPPMLIFPRVSRNKFSNYFVNSTRAFLKLLLPIDDMLSHFNASFAGKLCILYTKKYIVFVQHRQFCS